MRIVIYCSLFENLQKMTRRLMQNQAHKTHISRYQILLTSTNVSRKPNNDLIKNIEPKSIRLLVLAVNIYLLTGYEKGA